MLAVLRAVPHHAPQHHKGDLLRVMPAYHDLPRRRPLGRLTGRGYLIRQSLNEVGLDPCNCLPVRLLIGHANPHWLYIQYNTVLDFYHPI
jgi:hypothetical protein